MKSFFLTLAIFILVSCTQSQVQPIPKAVTDSLAAHRAEINTLKASPVNLQPIMDSLTAHRARIGNLESKLIELKTGQVSFAGTAWRVAVYVPGITPSWAVVVTPVYTVETPVLDYLTRIVKTDSVVILRNLNGTPNLTVEYLGVTP